MKRVFAALQSLQMMQQPNRYEGRGNHAKAHRPGRGDEPAKKCTERRKVSREKRLQGSVIISPLAQGTG